MCGISGIIAFRSDSVEKDRIKQMMLAMKHRGPDDEGIYIKKNVGFGFVRLSILDLSSSGHQPMFSNDGRFVIIFNGEIFNYIELRKELENEGAIFRTNTDTEVLLNAFIHWGKSCLDKLNGMWAFVIFDVEENEVFGARDRYGIKPLYYSLTDSEFIFASEIPAILKVRDQKPKANSTSIFEYLVFNRTDQDETTFFEDIFRLKHGHYFIVKNDSFIVRKWYDLKQNIKKSFANPGKYKEMLIDSINLRLRSDVPLGICFSGGLDSSTLLSLISENNKNINTFSAVYLKGESGDESEFINIYKDTTKNMHFVTPTSETLFEDLNDLIETHAEPIPDTSPYAQYKVMQLAKKEVTVTLDGQGNDEQLGGYHYFFGLYYKELLMNFKWFKLINELAYYKKRHRSNFGIKTLAYFLMPARLRTKLNIRKRGYLLKSFRSRNFDLSKASISIYNSKTLKDGFLDHFEYKLEHLLKWEDKNSMRFSVEARVPFLDHRIVERAINLPNEMYINRGVTKTILREATKGIIPEKIRNRQDKMGFSTPEAEWFRKDVFKVLIFDILNSDSFKQRNIIDPEIAKRLYTKHLEREIEISKEIWKWINLELWFRKFID